MRIHVGAAEDFVEAVVEVVRMFKPVGLAVHVLRPDARILRKIRFPQPVRPHHLLRVPHTLGRQHQLCDRSR